MQWQTSAMEQEGLNPFGIEAMVNAIEVNEWSINSIVIVKNGKLVYERYTGDNNATTPHAVFSVTKSFMSTLIGIALKEGYLQSLDQKMVDFFPNVTIDNLSAEKQNITIEHLLTMTSGLDWDEFSFLTNDLIPFLLVANPLQYVLDQPVIEEPGTVWNYNTGGPHILSAILNEVTNMTTRDFAQQYLFGPLGIFINGWDTDPNGLHYGGQGISMNLHDMAKFGFLFLNDGYWDGQQILPDGWVELASLPIIEADGNASYGYLWWIYPEIGTFVAEGLGGQQIFVLPEYDMVVSFTSAIAIGDDPFNFLVGEFIVPSVFETTNGTVINPTNTTTFPTSSVGIDRTGNPETGLLLGIGISAVLMGTLIIAVRARRNV